MGRQRTVILAALVLLAASPSPRASEPVDLEIVIATDVSSSIDDAEAALQRQGVAGAFRSAEVIRAIRTGGFGKIAVACVDWSSEPWNRVIVDWRVIHDEASALAFADELLAAPRTYGQGTSIGGAMRMGARMIESNGFDGTRRVIDMSGDGPNNRGSLEAARAAVLASGITVNGLPIITGDYGTGNWGAYFQQIDKYYEAYVIGGPGAFSLPAYGFAEFAEAMKRKLILEISGDAPARDLAQGEDRGAPTAGGEAR